MHEKAVKRNLLLVDNENENNNNSGKSLKGLCPSVAANAAPRGHRLFHKSSSVRCRIPPYKLAAREIPVASKTTQDIASLLTDNQNYILLRRPHNFGYRPQINQIATELETPFLLA